MITTDELKVQLADYGKAVKDLEEALAIDASRKRVQELEHTMSRPGFYDDAELSKKVFDEVGDLKGKLNRFEKLQGLYDDAETMLVMLDEEYDPEMVPEAEEAVNAVGKAVDELQLMTMLHGQRTSRRQRGHHQAQQQQRHRLHGVRGLFPLQGGLLHQFQGVLRHLQAVVRGQRLPQRIGDPFQRRTTTERPPL